MDLFEEPAAILNMVNRVRHVYQVVCVGRKFQVLSSGDDAFDLNAVLFRQGNCSFDHPW